MRAHSRLWQHCLLVPGPFSRLWETASLSCPDIWVRKPDCLHLLYNPPLLGFSQYSLHEDIFCESSFVRRQSLAPRQNTGNKATPRSMASPILRASKTTHVSHTLRGFQWELQTMHQSTPPRNSLESESDTDLQQSSPPGLVLEVFNMGDWCWPSQPYNPSYEPPHMEQPTNSRGQSHLCFIPAQMPVQAAFHKKCTLFHGCGNQVQFDLGLYHSGNPGPTHAVNSYRPSRSTSTLPPSPI